LVQLRLGAGGVQRERILTQDTRFISVDVLGDLVLANEGCDSSLNHGDSRAASDENDRLNLVLSDPGSRQLLDPPEHWLLFAALALTMLILASARASSIGAVNLGMYSCALDSNCSRVT
jgi:hypothetical protein